MKDYYPEYIVLKQRHERMKSVHDAKIEKLNREIAELRAKIIQPVVMPKFDLELGDVLTIVSRVTQIFQEDIISQKRHREIVTARALFSYISRIHLKKPFKHIGRYLNRDHSTIIHLVNNYDSYLQMQYKEETIFYNECVNRVNNAKAKGILTHNS
jgi:chromosomal replication initiation ATPase DnaA